MVISKITLVSYMSIHVTCLGVTSLPQKPTNF